MNIVTYHSNHADTNRSWIAFLVVNGEYLTVYFNGSTEAEAMAKAKAEWDNHEVERERNIAAREEGRRKAAETLARKKAGVA